MQHIYNILTVPCEKTNTVSVGSSIMKNIVVYSTRSKFAVKLIFWIALISVSRACCLLVSIAIILWFSSE